MLRLPVRFVALLAIAGLLPAAEFKPSKAAARLNETATADGSVAQVSGETGHVFVNFDRPFPNQSFTAFVPGAKLAAAGGMQFLDSQTGKTVRVTGAIISCDGRPEIVVASKEQIANSDPKTYKGRFIRSRKLPAYDKLRHSAQQQMPVLPQLERASVFRERRAAVLKERWLVDGDGEFIRWAERSHTAGPALHDRPGLGEDARESPTQ